MIECEVSVQIDSERVVPRQGRAEWLEKHGIPSERMTFIAKAPAKAWQDAGCHLSVTGKVIKVSTEAVDALCEPARDLVRYDHPNNRIRNDHVAEALHVAKMSRQQAMRDQEEARVTGEEAKVRASKWATMYGSMTTKEAVKYGYDVRTLVLTEARIAFEEFLEAKCMYTYRDERYLSERNSPQKLALKNRRVIEQAIEDFDFPDFVDISMMGIYRTNFNEMFVTVVAVKFYIAGVAPIICVWNAEKEI